jgi:hypothetical protein
MTTGKFTGEYIDCGENLPVTDNDRRLLRLALQEDEEDLQNTIQDDIADKFNDENPDLHVSAQDKDIE